MRTQSIHRCSLSTIIIIKRSLFTINLINYTIYLPKGCELKVSCGGGREREGEGWRDRIRDSNSLRFTIFLTVYADSWRINARLVIERLGSNNYR